MPKEIVEFSYVFAPLASVSVVAVESTVNRSSTSRIGGKLR